MSDFFAAVRAVENHESLLTALSDLVHIAAVAAPMVADEDIRRLLLSRIEAAYAALAPHYGQRDLLGAIGRPGEAAAVFAEQHGVSYAAALVACNMD